MKKLALAALGALSILFGSSVSHASYRSETCADASGSYVYVSQRSVPNFSKNYWLINGQELDVQAVEMTEVAGTEKILESRGNGIQGSTTSVKKFHLEFPDGYGDIKRIDTWMLCTLSGGI